MAHKLSLTLHIDRIESRRYGSIFLQAMTLTFVLKVGQLKADDILMKYIIKAAKVKTFNSAASPQRQN